jgi:hypothetical protein
MKTITVILLLALGQTMIIESLLGCGDVLLVPRNNYEGLNEDGHFSHWREIATIGNGKDGGALPLILNFNSGRDASSPYAGAGWALMPFDANIVQVDENMFILTQPNGLKTRFYRQKGSPTILRGPGSWLAEINGDTITARKDCGWTLQYTRGSLTSFASANARYELKRDPSSFVTSVLRNGTSIATISPRMEKDTVISYEGKAGTGGPS